MGSGLSGVVAEGGVRPGQGDEEEAGAVPGHLEEKQGDRGSEHPAKGKRGVHFDMLIRKDLRGQQSPRGAGRACRRQGGHTQRVK